MKHLRWQVLLGLLLVALSALFYFIHFLVFHDPHHIFIYMVGDIAFVPVEVLLVTLIIHKVLEVREKRTRLEKLNMVLGTFFSEVGTKLLTYFSDFDPRLSEIKKDLVMNGSWSEHEFLRVRKKLKSYHYEIDIEKVSLNNLKDFALDKRDFLLRLLQNPNLLEHESFTELLRAVFHMTEELEWRKDLNELPSSDKKHLAGDIRRAYGLLVKEWIDYMKHLKKHFPYLFSLAMRTNPFDQNASPVIY
jgi:hypothetical protein